VNVSSRSLKISKILIVYESSLTPYVIHRAKCVTYAVSSLVMTHFSAGKWLELYIGFPTPTHIQYILSS